MKYIVDLAVINPLGYFVVTPVCYGVTKYEILSAIFFPLDYAL